MTTVKKLIFFLFLSFFSISGCTFLGGGDDSASEDAYEEEEFTGDDEGDFDEEDEEDFEDEEDEDFEDEEDEEAEEFDADEDELEEGEEAFEEGEKKGGLKGFFGKIFGSSDEEEELEEEDEQGDYADQEGDYEEYAEEDEEVEGEEVSIAETATEEATTASAEQQAPPAPAQPPAPAKVISLNKVLTVPYKKAGYLINAVYIARPNDTLEGISQKIYGSNQSDILRQINSHLQSRAVVVGDKIYYNSPSRQNDSSKLLFYYEDIGAPSSFYMLSPGDNIRQVASQLLGHPKSWKEIWATNPELVSKGEVTKSINIVYWSTTTTAKAEPAPEPAPEEPPMDESLAQNQGMEEPVEDFPPPPVLKPEPQVQDQKGSIAGILKVIFQQKEMFVVFLGIIIILILMIRLILKKRKQRDFDYTATNIEV